MTELAAEPSALGAVVLCGGRSQRMGRSKAWLDFGGRPLLVRVVERLSEVARPVVVVAAPGQELPALPPRVLLASDPVEGDGPLRGIAVGLAALAPLARYAFVCATDAPFVTGAFVARLFALRHEGGREHAAVVVRTAGHVHPLQALYRTSLAPTAEALLAAGERRAVAFVAACAARVVEPAELLADPALRGADPDLSALRNLNTEADYLRALADAARRGD